MSDNSRDIKDSRFGARSRKKPQKRGRFHRVWNPILRADVFLNDKYYREYQRLRDRSPSKYPYQSKHHKRDGIAYFADINQITAYVENKREYRELAHPSGEEGPVFDTDTDVDIFKMLRPGSDIDGKYLIQQDPENVAHHQANMRNLIDILNKTEGFVFIPYIPGVDFTSDSITVERHNRYEKISIVNNEEFMAYLKHKIKDRNELGRLLLSFNKLFYHYNSLLDFMTEYLGKPVTEDNLMLSIAEYEKKRVWGIEKNVIKRRLKRRNAELKAFRRASQTCKISNADSYDRYIDELTSSDRIEENDLVSKVQGCNAATIELDNLIYDDLDQLETNDEYLDFCTNMKFAPTDTFDGYTFQSICIDYVKQIKNNTIRQLIVDNIELRTNREKSMCLNISDEARIESFVLLEEYMPEWHERVYENKIRDAFEHRQLLIGNIDATHIMRNCTLMYRADPFISRECYLPGLIHDVELNKLIIACIANSNDVFPIRLIGGKDIEAMNMYESYKVRHNKDSLLGSILIKVKDTYRDDQTKYYNIYMYYVPEHRWNIRLVNFRSNVIIPGTVMEHIRLLRIELNTLLYYQDDVGMKLHFYKVNTIDGNFDILVSKYNMDEIRERYRLFDSIKANAAQSLGGSLNKSLSSLTDEEYDTYLDSLLGRLTEVKMTKNFDKKFEFIDAEQSQKGGTNTNDDKDDKTKKSYRFDIKCLGKNNYRWNIQTGDNPVVFDSEVFSLSLFQEQIRLIDRFFGLAGNKIYDTKCIPIHYLKGFTTHAISKLKTKEITELWKSEGITQKDSTGKLYRSALNIIEEGQTILAYNFESTVSIYLYHQLLNNLKPELGKKYIVFAKNNYLLDGLVLYGKSILLKSLGDDIDFFVYNYKYTHGDTTKYSKYEPHEKTINYLQVNKIESHMIDEPMNNDWIDRNAEELSNIDYSIIDVAVGIDDIIVFRYAYLFQSQLSPIILSLKKMNMGGVLILNIFIIPNKMVFNFISYLSCFFEETFFDDFWESELHATGQLIHSVVIFKGFKGMDDDEISKMMNLNKVMYELDNTGGYRFDIKDAQLRSEFDVDDHGDRVVASEFVTNIFDVINPEIEAQYDAYKEYMKMKMLGSIRNFTQRMNIFLSREDTEKIETICTDAKATAIYLAKKYNLPLLDWVEEIPDEYLDKMIENNFEAISYSFIRKLPNVPDLSNNLKVSKTIECESCPKLDETKAISEKAYLYIEKINFDRYRDVELFVNYKYKDLNRLLQKEYNITINGKYVSRAWIKLYELLSDSKLLEGFENVDELKVFHICEAPGNFVNSMSHYIKENTDIKKHNWTAQSLKADMGGLSDQYGFIAETRDRWDRGPKDTGDIMDRDNFQYYFEKYGGTDFLIGDCGEGWMESVDDNRNLTILQMFYALLFPKVGGGFVIKTFTMKYTRLYMALLYLACSMYEEVQLFKSYTNFWSFEIYIIGKGKKEISKEYTPILLECLDRLFAGETVYPISEIPDEFVKEYEKIIHAIVSYVADINKFFVFLSTNTDLFKRNKGMIAEIIKEKNSGWLDKYIRKKGGKNI